MRFDVLVVMTGDSVLWVWDRLFW